MGKRDQPTILISWSGSWNFFLIRQVYIQIMPPCAAITPIRERPGHRNCSMDIIVELFGLNARSEFDSRKTNQCSNDRSLMSLIGHPWSLLRNLIEIPLTLIILSKKNLIAFNIIIYTTSHISFIRRLNSNYNYSNFHSIHDYIFILPYFIERVSITKRLGIRVQDLISNPGKEGQWQRPLSIMGTHV